MSSVTAPPNPTATSPWNPGGSLDRSVAAMNTVADGTARDMMFGKQGVTGKYAQGWRDVATAYETANDVQAFRKSKGDTGDINRPETLSERAQRGAAQFRCAQTAISSVMSAISMPQDLLNIGFATATNAIAGVFPSMPAAFLGSLYVGLPHAHSHPPSLIPPAPPVPLPSLGAVLLGTSVKVLINSMPAARCGDIGLAPTCVGIVPFFQIKTGSSNVFIGGNRAARMLDICSACAKGDDDRKIEAGKIMAAIGKAAGAAAKGIEAAGKVAGVMAIVADAAEAATEPDPAMESAKALAAAMGAAQMAADAAAKAITKTMGTDPWIPPGNNKGAITIGSPNVLIGGFPMVNIPNPVDLILGKLKRYVPKKPKADPPSPPVKTSCPK